MLVIKHYLLSLLLPLFILVATLYFSSQAESTPLPTSTGTSEQTNTHDQPKIPIEISPFKASYTLKRSGISVGQVSRELKETTEGNYLFESLSKPIGIATFFVKDIIWEQSSWRLLENHFRPDRYTYQRTGGKKDRHISLVFNWEDNRVTNIINNDAWKMDIPNNVQDKLLYQLSIMYDLKYAKKELTYEVADGGRLKGYSFKILSYETITTKIGQLKTVKIERTSKKKKTTIWCATERHFLPVKIEQNDDDGEFMLYIDSVEGL